MPVGINPTDVKRRMITGEDVYVAVPFVLEEDGKLFQHYRKCKVTSVPTPTSMYIETDTGGRTSVNPKSVNEWSDNMKDWRKPLGRA